MSSQKLQRARQLLSEKRYEEARSLLLDISDDPTAAKWLSKLDEMPPVSTNLFSTYEPPTQAAVKKSNKSKKERASQPRLTFLYLLNLIIIILLGLLLAGVLPIKVQLDEPIEVKRENTTPQPPLEEPIALEEPITIDGSVSISEAVDINGTVPVSINEPVSVTGEVEISSPVEIEGPVAVTFDSDLLTSANDDSPQEWEYLSVQYSQMDSFLGDDSRVEFVYSNDADYDVHLFGELMCLEDFGDYSKCVDKFRGQAYYLNLWGADGWELISLTNASTQYEYRIDMILKRPKSN